MGWKRSGWDSQMLKVLWPMEPVEPRTAIFFTLFILLGREGIYLGEGAKDYLAYLGG